MKKNLRLRILFFFLFVFFNVQAQAGLEEIKNAVLQGDYVQVKELCQNFLTTAESQEERSEAMYYLGLSGLYLEDYIQARELFNEVAKKTQGQDLSDQAFLGIMSSYYLEGDYRRSLKHAYEFLRKRKDSNFLSTAYLKIARANLKLSHWKPAQRYLQRILVEFENSLDAYTAKQLLEERAFFAVQVGAFLDYSRAQRLVEDLRAQGEYGYIVRTADREGRVFYRVRVGELSSLHSAQKVRRKLVEFGYPAIIYP